MAGLPALNQAPTGATTVCLASPGPVLEEGNGGRETVHPSET